MRSGSRVRVVGLLVSLAGLALALSGCDSGPSELASYWEKPGATPRDRRADIDLCVKDTREKGAGLPAIKKQAIYNQCMIAHGWTFRE